jgi:hypothetical protein
LLSLQDFRLLLVNYCFLIKLMIFKVVLMFLVFHWKIFVIYSLISEYSCVLSFWWLKINSWNCLSIFWWKFYKIDYYFYIDENIIFYDYYKMKFFMNVFMLLIKQINFSPTNFHENDVFLLCNIILIVQFQKIQHEIPIIYILFRQFFLNKIIKFYLLFI